MKKEYIEPRTALIPFHPEHMLAASPGETGLKVGGKADADFTELSREEKDFSSGW